MGAYDTWRKYMAVKAHFERWNYYCHDKEFKLPHTTVKNYEKRNDQWVWKKLDTRIDVVDFLISHRLMAPSAWIGDVACSTEFEGTHCERLKRAHGLTYFLMKDLDKLHPNGFDELFRLQDGNHPLLLKKLWANEISMETATVLIGMSGCVPVWKLRGDTMVKGQTLRAIKYFPFLDVHEEKTRKILLNHFSS